MHVRIRLGRGVPKQRMQGKNRRLALALAGLLVPVSFLAFILAFWRLAADLSYAGEFAIQEGLFSHWHVWIGIAAALSYLTHRLNRYGRGGRLLGR